MKKYFLVFIFFMLGACSQFGPFIDARREAGQVNPVGSSRLDRPVVCYGFVGTQQDRDALAQQVCEDQGKVAVYQATDSFSCKLLTPQKDIYTCQTPQKGEKLSVRSDRNSQPITDIEPLPESEIQSIVNMPREL